MKLIQIERSNMAGLWLYTITERAGLDFEFGGQRWQVSLKNYEKLLRNEKLGEKQWWYITQNWKEVRIDDEVLIYTGDEKKGIIGYATIQGVDWREEYWAIHMNLNFERCRSLLANPIPAETVHEWVHYPRKNIINLTTYKAQIHRLIRKNLAQGNT
jgi:hypothetical protein